MSEYVLHVCIAYAVMALGFLWEWRRSSDVPTDDSIYTNWRQGCLTNDELRWALGVCNIGPYSHRGYQPRARATDCAVASMEPPWPLFKCPHCDAISDADYDDTMGKCWSCHANYNVSSLKPPKGGTAVEPPGEVKVKFTAVNKLDWPTIPDRETLPQPGDITPLGVVNSVNVDVSDGDCVRTTVEYV